MDEEPQGKNPLSNGENLMGGSIDFKKYSMVYKSTWINRDHKEAELGLLGEPDTH